MSSRDGVLALNKTSQSDVNSYGWHDEAGGSNMRTDKM